MILKVCGMRDGDNIRAVEQAVHPQMMGFICWPGSSRYVSERPSYLPQCIRVGVFVNQDVEFIRTKIRQLGLNRLQLHGDETPRYCERVVNLTGLPVMKALSVFGEEDVHRSEQYEGICDLLLFDTKCRQHGGSGKQFDWDILHHYHGNTPFLLAGGIGPDDGHRIKAFRHPMFLGIDVNSRFERTPGIKDLGKIEKLRN